MLMEFSSLDVDSEKQGQNWGRAEELLRYTEVCLEGEFWAQWQRNNDSVVCRF